MHGRVGYGRRNRTGKGRGKKEGRGGREVRRWVWRVDRGRGRGRGGVFGWPAQA